MSKEGQDVWYAHHKLGKSESILNKKQPDLSRPQLTQVDPQSHTSPKKVDMQWVGEAFEKNEIDVMPDQVQLYESILLRNEIFSKKDLASLTEEEFMHHIVGSHVEELMPILRKKKFESLHACVTNKNVEGSAGQEHNSMLHSQKELEEKMAYLQKEMDKCRRVNLNDVASKKKLDSVQRKLDAVFQSTVVGHGNQVSDAVATKQGATISIVNPKADEQLAEHGLLLMQLLEEFSNLKCEFEMMEEKQSLRKNK